MQEIGCWSLTHTVKATGPSLEAWQPQAGISFRELGEWSPGPFRPAAKGWGVERKLWRGAEVWLLKGGSKSTNSALMAQEEEDVRDYNLTEEQKATKDKYPPVNRKYECE